MAQRGDQQRGIGIADQEFQRRTAAGLTMLGSIVQTAADNAETWVRPIALRPILPSVPASAKSATNLESEAEEPVTYAKNLNINESIRKLSEELFAKNIADDMEAAGLRAR
jgi:hypothetical protein